MSSNPKDNYWDVGPLGEVRSFGLALADSGESVRGGGGDKKAKVLERVRRDASPSFKGDMGDKTVRGIKRNLKLMKGSEIQQEEKESENESDEEMMEEKEALPDIPASLPNQIKVTFPFPTVTEEERKLVLSRWKTRWEDHQPSHFPPPSFHSSPQTNKQQQQRQPRR